MFGVGYQEMMVLALFALIIFGPGKLPEVMSEAGRHYKKFRDMTSELSGEFEKTVAEAKGELDSVMGDLGPMQKQVSSISKSVQKDLGGTSKSGAKTTKSTSTTTPKSKSSTTSSTTKKSTTSSTTKKSTTSSTTAKPTDSRAQPTKSTATVVASKDDPYADYGIFEQAEKVTKRRARSATPASIDDLTPRWDVADESSEVVSDTPRRVDQSSADDPLARARARRRKAGYARI